MKINAVSYILAIIFILSGGAKVAGLEFEIVAFERWGYPLWFMYFTGFAEVALSIMVIVNRVDGFQLRRLAAPGMVAIMIGAIVTHVVNAEWSMVLVAGVIFAMASFLSVELWRNREAVV